MDWTKLKGVPAGFADGVDSDTTYAAGAGLTLGGGTFSLADGGVTGAKVADGTLSDADVSPSAAIGWAKVSKIGSSLLDLETRDASALSSGTLADGRLSPNVALLSGVQTFTGAKTFGATTVFNGNVGIGSSAPASKLEVAGTVHSTSGGFRFPDGTVQTTAAAAAGGGFLKRTFSGTTPAGYSAAFDGDPASVTPSITAPSGSNVQVDLALSSPAYVDLIKMKYALVAAGGTSDRIALQTFHEDGSVVQWWQNAGSSGVVSLWGPGALSEGQFSSERVQPHSKVTKVRIVVSACCSGPTTGTIYEIEAFTLGGSVIS